MTIRTQLDAVQWARVSATLLFLFSTTGAAWAQQWVRDGRVEFYYPYEQWSPDLRTAALEGTEPNEWEGIVRKLGWWYRLQDDTHEYAMPGPDRKTFQDGEMVLEWNNLRGSGLMVMERNVVIDGEGPSGGIYSSLTIYNLTNVPQTLDAFHFVVGTVSGTQRTFHVESISSDFLKFTNTTNPSAVVRYRAEGPSHFQARSFCNLLTKFRDAEKTDLADTVPDTGVAPDVCAAFQFTFTIPAGGVRTAYVSLTSRLPDDHIRSAFRDLTPHPGLLTCASDPCNRNPWHFFFKRTTWMREQKAWPVPTGYHFGGVDDFDGDSDDEVVVHNPTTGVIRVGGVIVNATIAAGWALRSTGDFNADGKADLLFQWAGGPAPLKAGPLRIWLMNGPERLAVVVPDQANYVVEPGWVVVGSADFNNDGFTDILWHNRDSGELMAWGMVRAVLVVITFPFPVREQSPSWRPVAVGDFGRGTAAGTPGAPDIVWQDELTGQVAVWHMNFNWQRTARTLMTRLWPPIVGPR